MKMIKNLSIPFLALAGMATGGWAANEAEYTRLLERLRTELTTKLP